MKKITVIGAGKGGHAIAGYTALLGNRVVLLTTDAKKQKAINLRGNRISLTGIINGEGQLHDVTTDVQEAIEGSKLVFIVTDATAHRAYAEKLAPYLHKQDIVLISPGVGGALEFFKRINEKNPENRASVSETDTLVYACKVPETGVSYIKAQKNSIIFTTLPEDRSIREKIQRLYPQFRDVHEPLMGIDDSPVFHICGMIFNAERIQRQENFNFYIDGITPLVAQYMEEMDLERCKVAKALGIKHRTVRQWVNAAYGVPISNLYSMIQQTPPYQNTPEIPNRSPAPTTLIHRYLLEEMLLRAVPTSSIAEVLGVRIPKYEEMIDRATELTGIHFRDQGRTIEDMGLYPSQIENWKRRKFAAYATP